MPNRKYEKGARREREIVNHFREKGWYATRSAGSKSQYDCIAIDLGELTIRLIQVKGGRVKLKKLPIPNIMNVRQELWYKEKGKWKQEEIV